MKYSTLLTFTSILLLFTFHSKVMSCTIVSAVDANGNVWNANNEDGPAEVANFINVFPKKEGLKYGYYTLSYFSPEMGMGGNIQGGMNEAGLTFDFNAINEVNDFDVTFKEAFPKGDSAILPHILSNMNSVQEVIHFFEKYWFQSGFTSAQMHVADKQGRFAVISASGIKLVEKGESLVSTNFDICGGEDSTSCWRYPIAKKRLAELGASFSTMSIICRETKNPFSLYSNIQNLTTGDIWFFSQHDPDVLIHTSISKMLSYGRKSYTFSDLNSLIETRPTFQPIEHKPVSISESQKMKYLGNYENDMLGKINIEDHPKGITVHWPYGESEVYYSKSESEFYLPNADVQFAFTLDNEKSEIKLNFYDGEFWSFSARQINNTSSEDDTNKH